MTARERFCDLLGYQFQRVELLELAFTHKSYANELMNGSSTTADDNERLEFLGDAVLDLTMADLLMKRFPNDSEGALSKKRASLVNEESLSQIARTLGFENLLRLGKGEIKTGGLHKPRILASALEAVFGAIFQDSGFILVSNVVEKLFAPALERIGSDSVDFSSDFKTRLQERAQSSAKSTPTYRLESESGPDHEKVFFVIVELEGRHLATGSGKSKKAAEQDAAKNALETFV